MKQQLIRLSFLLLYLLIGFSSSKIYGFQVKEDSTVVVPTAVQLSDVPLLLAEDKKHLDYQLLPIINQEVILKQEVLKDSLESRYIYLVEISETLLEKLPDFSLIGSTQNRWGRLNENIIQVEKKITKYTEGLNQANEALEFEKEKWGLTINSFKGKSVNKELYSSAKLLVGDYRRGLKALKDSMNHALVVQKELSSMRLSLLEYQSRLEGLEDHHTKQLLAKRSPALWQLEFSALADSLQEKTNAHGMIFQMSLDESLEYLAYNVEGMLPVPLLIIAVFVLIFYIKKSVPNYQGYDSKWSALIHKIKANPLLVSYFFGICFMLKYLAEMPVILSKIIGALLLLPFGLLFSRLYKAPYRWLVFIISLALWTENLLEFGYVNDAESRVVDLFVMLLLIVFLKQIKAFKGGYSSAIQDVYLNRLMKKGLSFFLGVLVVLLLANFFGYVYFYRLFFSATLVSFLSAFVCITLFVLAKGILDMLFVTKIASKLVLIQELREEVFTFLSKVLKWSFVIFWSVLTLKSFFLWDEVQELFYTVWNFGTDLENFHLTVGGLVSFFLIITGAVLTSQVIKTILRYEILSRMELSRGVPMAISSITHYVLITTGFLVALAYSGFNLEKLSIVAGALGVGIGFGLQNIVSNFISGLILVFERPITEGDTVTVKNVEGTVKKIGIRSTIIEQYDGAELIVPNASLISDQVANWTMSNKRRRVKVMIYTDLDADPEQVLQLVKEGLDNLDGVLKFPVPNIYYQGQLQHAREFMIFYWLASDILINKSNVQLMITRVLKNACINTVVPQYFKNAPELLKEGKVEDSSNEEQENNTPKN